MARFRAVVVIQPPGFGGRPSTGHFRRARANASWTASSARSMSPKMRISVATERPDSSRKIRPTSAASASANGLPRHSGKWAYLDGAVDRLGDLGRPTKSGIEVRRLDHVEA